MVKVEAKAKLKRGVVTDSKSTYGNKAATNSAFKRKHGLKYSSSSSKGSHHVGLRGLDQVTFEEIQKLGQQAARKYLEKTGVILKQTDPKMSFCVLGLPMSASGDGSMFRCSRRQCDKKPKLTNPAVAFSPLAGFVSAGWEVDYVICLRSAYALGAKITNDSAIHMLRRKEDTLSQAEHKVDYFYKRLKIPLAYTEVKYAKNFEFKADVVEPDSGRMGVRKDKAAAQKIHLGRTLVLKGRFTKKWVARALPDSVSKIGRGMGAETRQDVDNPIKTHMGSATVGAPDGGRAFHGALKASGIPTLTGVNHMKKVFTPVGKLLKSTLDTGTTRMLRQRCKGKQPCVKEAARYFTLPAGDNSAERTIGCIKGVMRRLHNVGRVTKSPHQKSIQSLSAAALHRGSGFTKVLEAMKLYRDDCSKGAIHMDPKKAFDIAACTWLHT